MATERKAFAAANLANRYVIVSAGLNNAAQGAVALNSVERYDVSNDAWEQLPALNKARQGHASVATGGSVFVLCGATTDGDAMNSVEVLLDAASSVDLLGSWISIPILTSDLLPRWMPAVSVLNEDEIVVLGGTGIVDDEVSDLGDAIVLDVSTPETPEV